VAELGSKLASGSWQTSVTNASHGTRISSAIGKFASSGQLVSPCHFDLRRAHDNPHRPFPSISRTDCPLVGFAYGCSVSVPGTITSRRDHPMNSILPSRQAVDRYTRFSFLLKHVSINSKNAPIIPKGGMPIESPSLDKASAAVPSYTNRLAGFPR